MYGGNFAKDLHHSRTERCTFCKINHDLCRNMPPFHLPGFVRTLPWTLTLENETPILYSRGTNFGPHSPFFPRPILFHTPSSPLLQTPFTSSPSLQVSKFPSSQVSKSPSLQVFPSVKLNQNRKETFVTFSPSPASLLSFKSMHTYPHTNPYPHSPSQTTPN